MTVRSPIISPKLWKSGGEQQRISSSVRFILWPTKKALFKIFLCVKQAALGDDVVPDVNCILVLPVT